MPDRDHIDDIDRLRRVARRIVLEAGRAAPALAAQLRALAAKYEAEAAELAPAPAERSSLN